MARARALHVFQVAAAGVRLRVRVLPHVVDVDAEYREGRRRALGKVVHGYFHPAPHGHRVVGTVAIPLAGSDLREVVPHEVSHAVIYHLLGVSARDDEGAANAIGLLCKAIFSKLAALGAA